MGRGREGRAHRDEWLRRLRRDAPYLEWADIVFASAMTGQRVERILREARRVAEERYRRVPTADVNRVIGDAVAAHPPPTARGRGRGSCTRPRSRWRRRRSSSS